MRSSQRSALYFIDTPGLAYNPQDYWNVIYRASSSGCVSELHQVRTSAREPQGAGVPQEGFWVGNEIKRWVLF